MYLNDIKPSACVNSAKTEFLLLGLKPRLNKVHNPTLVLTDGQSVPPTASARNLDFILILILPSPITSLLSLVHVSTTSVIFVAYIRPVFDLIWLAPSAHLLFTLDLTTAIRCRPTIVFLKRS